MARRRLGELLILAGAIDELQLQAALGEQRKWGRPLGATLVHMGILDEMTMISVLSQQLNIAAVDLEATHITPEALNFLDHEHCMQYSCIPFAYEKQGSFLDLAMADPTNPELFDRIRVLTRCNLRPRLAGPRAIERAIRRYYLGEKIERKVERQENRPWIARPDERVFEEASLGGPVPDAKPIRPPTGEYSAVNSQRDALILQLHQAVQQIKAHLDRDEKVLRKLMTLIVEKGLCSREELIAKIHED